MPTIESISPASLPEYASIPMTLEATSILELAAPNHGLAGLTLRERPLTTPYTKDYDALEPPSDWQKMFDISNWGIFLIRDATRRPIAGATVAWNTANCHMLEGAQDIACLWDIRTHPAHRRLGHATALFHHATAWAKSRQCTLLKIETQIINLPACRFYARMGATLGQIHRHAYRSTPSLAHETQLIWYLNLTDQASPTN